MSIPFLFYVNADGSGHIRRTKQIIRALDAPVHVFIDERKQDSFDDLAQVTVHPLAVPDILELYRNLVLEKHSLNEQLTYLKTTPQYRLFTSLDPKLVYIDVCMEFALFCRLLHQPYVYTLMHGDRLGEAAQKNAFSGALALLAPYPEIIADSNDPGWLRAKTTFTGSISPRAEFKPVLAAKKSKHILCLAGEGFSHNYRSELTPQLVARIAPDFPDYTFKVAAKSSLSSYRRGNYEYLGFVSNLEPYLEEAEIVVGTTGYGLVAEAAQFGAKFLTIPAKTPNDEQLRKAEILQAKNLARIISTPASVESWREALAATVNLQTLHAYYSPQAASLAARFLTRELSAF